MARTCRWFGLLVLIVSLAGCGVTTGEESAQHSLAPTFTPIVNVMPTSIPTPTPNSSVTFPCSPHPGSPTVTVGDLQATIGISNLSYPSRKLPDGIPLAPFKLDMSSPASLDAQLPPNPLTNPSMTEAYGGYWASICNTSRTQAHALEGVMVRIAGLAAYSGQLNEWDAADVNCGTYYARPQGVSGGGCGGAEGGMVCMHATFPAAGGVGTTVSAAFDANQGCMTGAALPLELAPGQQLNVALGITRPSTPGTYTFVVSLATDAGSVTFAPTAPVMLAQVAHKWDGEACATAAMQVQIPPATNPPTTYICPE